MEQVIYLIISSIVGLLSSICLFLLKRIMNRLDEMEVEVQQRTTEAEVRQLLQDKLDPIKDRIMAIDIKLERLLDMFLRKQ